MFGKGSLRRPGEGEGKTFEKDFSLPFPRTSIPTFFKAFFCAYARSMDKERCASFFGVLLQTPPHGLFDNEERGLWRGALSRRVRADPLRCTESCPARILQDNPSSTEPTCTLSPHTPLAEGDTGFQRPSAFGGCRAAPCSSEPPRGLYPSTALTSLGVIQPALPCRK